MGEVQQRLLAFLVLLALIIPGAAARKFYDDDPIWQVPAPMPVKEPNQRKLSEYYDFFYMSFGKPGERATREAPIEPPVAAGAVNTLGEVPDSMWYTNRHGRKRMSIDELRRGPGISNPPSTDDAWIVTAAKSEGVTPGFTIKDSKGRRYMLKFDSPETHELGTGADVMGTKFFYALGYFTPENYIVYFHPEQIVVAPGTKFIDHRGVERDLRQADIGKILSSVARDASGRYRAIASLFLEGKPLGPFRYNGVREDDPNDIVPHEHRRDLRGLKVFAAWLNHTDSKSLNTLDTIVDYKGKKVIRHHLIDFSAAFGTDAFEPKSPRAGHVYLLDWPDAMKTFFTLGLYAPAWVRADYKHVNGVGRIGTDAFDPEQWKSHYYNPAFSNCLPDDGFWAAKQIMRFTEPEIRALVGTAEYSDKAGVEYLVQVLVQRQRRIGQEYFSAVLPLDDFRVDEGSLEFEDLAVKYGFKPPRTYRISWSRFNNETRQTTPIPDANTPALPSTDGYLVAKIDAGEPHKAVSVYLRAHEIVGIERYW
jgi:hypothetical protein